MSKCWKPVDHGSGVYLQFFNRPSVSLVAYQWPKVVLTQRDGTTNPQAAMSISPTQRVNIFGIHIWKQLTAYRKTFDESSVVPPLFVAMQGPQGSGEYHVRKPKVKFHLSYNT